MQWKEQSAMEDADDKIPKNHLSVESVRMMAESVGISGLNEEIVHLLNADIEFRVKEVVQDAKKFCTHAKRRKMMPSDVDCALRVKNIEPLYGFDCAEYVPFSHTSGGGKELFYQEEQELDLVELISAPLPRVSVEPTLRTHWLAVNGIQPAIPYNPIPVSLDNQQKESLCEEPSYSKSDDKSKSEESIQEWPKLNKAQMTHSLSLEQQLYYKEMTEACIGGSDAKRQEALVNLSTDTSLYQLLPYFSKFIAEGIKVNISQRKLNMLKFLMKMAKALADNTSIYLSKCLPELVPAIMSCLLGKQLCMRPEAEDHWSVRDFAAKIIAIFCKKFSDPSNSLQTRVIRIYSKALLDTTRGLSVHYGAVMGLVELGQDAVTSVVIPKLKWESQLIKLMQKNDASNMLEQLAANRLQTLLQKHCPRSLMQIRKPTDTLEQYQNDYGHLGAALFNQVRQARLQAQQQSQLRTLATTTAITKSIATKPPPLPLVTGSTSVVGKPTTPVLKSPVTPQHSPYIPKLRTTAAATTLASPTEGASSGVAGETKVVKTQKGSTITLRIQQTSPK